jgi:AAA+ ATPase superfamily predicted ATPase
MKKLKNPFLLTGFYSKEYFCNRESEIKELKDHFINERNVVLFSWRRIGKTALLKCFLDDIVEEAGAETLYIDLLGTRDLSTAISKLTRAVYERYGETVSGISVSFKNLLSKTGLELSFDPLTGVPRFSIGVRQSENIEKSLEAIGGFLSNRKKRVILVLDEFQQVTSYPEKDGEAVFRSWAQSYPGIRFFFSGSHRNMMLSMFTEKNRPFYRSAQLMQLDPIELKAYQDFVRHHFVSNKKSFDGKAFEEIYKWTRMQTYYIQLICNRIFGSYNGIDKEIIDEVYKQILDQESLVFSGYTRLLTNMQWKVLLAVAKEEPLSSPLAHDFISRYQLGAASSVSTALKMLKKNELIIVDEDKYYVHDVLLSRWLQTL